MNNLEINYHDPEDNSELTESSNSDMQIFSIENEQGFSSDLTVQQSRLKDIAKLQLRLTKDRVFNTPSLFKTLTKSLSRKNEIFYYISTEEMSIDISMTSGKVYLPLLTKSGIHSRLQKIPTDIRKKINMLHIGAVKILVIPTDTAFAI